MIIKLVGGGIDSFSKLYNYDDEELLIGIDSGADILIKNKLQVDIAIGDFDSTKIKDIEKKSKKTIFFKPQKDKSDLHLTLDYIASKEFQNQYLKNRNIKAIIIYNATGKRLDHYQVAINLLAKFTHFNMKIIDDKNLIYIVNSKTKFKKNKYKYISFFSIDKDTIISLSGFKYNLKNYSLSPFDNLCLSNEIVENEAILETNNKKILVIESN